MGNVYSFVSMPSPQTAMIFSTRMRPRRVLPAIAKHAILKGEYVLRMERLKSDYSSSVTGSDQGD